MFWLFLNESYNYIGPKVWEITIFWTILICLAVTGKWMFVCNAWNCRATNSCCVTYLSDESAVWQRAGLWRRTSCWQVLCGTWQVRRAVHLLYTVSADCMQTLQPHTTLHNVTCGKLISAFCSATVKTTPHQHHYVTVAIKNRKYYRVTH